MDFSNALAVYNNSFRGASAYALRKGFEEVAGAERRRHLLRADGRELAVPDRQRRHGLLPLGDRPEQRPDGDRAAVGRRRHHQRHVVLLDHRHRRSRSRPRPRRQVSDRAARLRRAAARGRLLRRAFEDEPRPLRRARLSRRQRPEARGRERQGEPEDLSLRAGRLRHQHRAGAEGTVRLAGEPKVPETKFIEGSGLAVQHHPAERLRLLRDDQRERPGRAGDQLRRRARRPARRHRHRARARRSRRTSG